MPEPVPDPSVLPADGSAALLHLLDHIPDGVLLMDREWRFTYVNAAARRISRLEPKDINGPTHWERYPETVGQPLERLYLEAVATQTERRIPDFYYAPYDLWLDVRAIPSSNGLAIYYRDVTAERKAQEQTRESRQLTSVALSVTKGVGAWEWDVTHDRVYADANFARVYGIEAARAEAGVPLEECMRYIPLEDRPAVQISLEQAANTGNDEFHNEHRLLLPDGTTRWVFSRGRCLRGPEGAALRYSGVTVDITERKRTEAALLQAEKLAAVGRMASSIAHEINNPLESITNLIYLARQHTMVPEARQYLDQTDQELRRVSVIANQTLRFHRHSTHPTDVSCLDLFTTVLNLYEARLRNANVRVEKRKRAERCITCFEGDVRQVLNNIVANAIDAMSTGTAEPGGRLLVRSREGTDWRTGRRGLVLTLADTGPGMTAETRNRIFEPFFTTKGLNGTGLGLWICAEIVARHEGRLLVRSSRDKAHHGTVFSLFLPFDKTLTPAVEIPGSS